MDIKVYLQYRLKEPTLIRTEKGGAKEKVKKGTVKKFSVDMAEFYLKNYPKMFMQVDRSGRIIEDQVTDDTEVPITRS